MTNQASQRKAGLWGTGTPQGAKVPYRIRKEFDSGITQRQKIDKTLNADFGTEAVIPKRPKGFLFVIRYLNIPAQTVNCQREEINVRIGEKSRFRIR